MADFAKFMASAYYAYKYVKLLGPKRVITVRGDRRMALKHDRKSLELVERLPLCDVNSVHTQSKHS